MSHLQRSKTHQSFVRRASRPVAMLLLLSGCFHYVPAGVTPLPGPQTEVRVTLNEPIDIPMGEFTLNGVGRIEGIVAEASDDTLGMVAKWLYPQSGRKYDALFASYTVPRADIKLMETWRFSGKRTFFLVGGGAAVTTLLINAIWRVVRGENSNPCCPQVEPS